MKSVEVPAGAMQFEFRPNPLLKWAWVLPRMRRTNYDSHCDCAFVYPIVEGLIANQKLIQLMREKRDAADSCGKFYVCACFGRVIE